MTLLYKSEAMDRVAGVCNIATLVGAHQWTKRSLLMVVAANFVGKSVQMY